MNPLRRMLTAMLVPMAIGVCHGEGARIGLIYNSKAWHEEALASAKAALAMFGHDAQLVFETCNYDGRPDLAAQCASRLADISKVSAVVGTSGEAPELAVAKVLDSKHVPFISLAPNPLWKSDRPPYLFRIRTTLGNVLTVGAEYAKEHRPFRSVAIVGRSVGQLPNGDEFWRTLFGSDSKILFKATGLQPNDLSGALQSRADLLVLEEPRPDDLRHLSAQTPGSKLLVTTMGTADAYRELLPKGAYIAVPISAPTQEARALLASYERSYGKSLSGVLLPMAAAIQVLLELGIARGKVSIGDLQKGQFKTVFGSLSFSSINGDARAEGLGAEVWEAGNTRGPVSAGTGGTRCTCGHTDCCKTQCCVDKGCSSGNCKNVKCMN